MPRMRRITLALVLAFSSTILFAQPRGRGWGAGAPRMYDTTTVQTVTGTIVSVERLNADRPTGGGVHLTLQTSSAPALDVALGPSWYIDELKTTFEKGDRINVKGSLVKIEGSDVLIAAEVTKGAETVVLRDVNGVPAWAGGRCR